MTTSHTTPSIPQESVRETDPNVLQRIAADPQLSVWVGASAGTGKTKVLTDRVLRLLLPRSEEQAGTPPHKILCLTFTKAAASEMALRISKVLAQWAILSDDALHEALGKLLGRSPRMDETQAARKLFAQVIDTPGGLKIMTIHSFCQSVLGRFPLEAGITPGFSVLDDLSASLLMEQARKHIYAQAGQQKTGALAKALDLIASATNEDNFSNLLGDIAKERARLDHLLGNDPDLHGFYTNLCMLLDIPAGKSSADFILDACQNDTFDEAGLREACRILNEHGGVDDQKHGLQLAGWLDMAEQERASNWDKYTSIYLTGDNEPRKRLAVKKIAEAYPHALQTLQRESERVLALHETLKKVQCAELTHALFLLGTGILKKYQDLKERRNVLDYDDLIILTARLLSSEPLCDSVSGAASPLSITMPGWVLYKLDQGLDHILIDEAQDTNPDQWTIIKALAEEFFSGAGNNDDIGRSIFTVGDEKQSIYSFQRASPEEFEKMRALFETRIKAARQDGWENIKLFTSFRSVRSVLDAVDYVFRQDDLARDPGFAEIKHTAFRSKQAGLVELWPVFESESAEKAYDPWEPPLRITEGRSGSSLCAENIATTIKSWIDNKEILESKNRPVQAGDIMVLVRSRGAFVNQLTRALKTMNIPVAGHDRMVLNDQLAVQDLLALAEFSLLPTDDLTLACLLKSPLIGMNEDDLFALSYNRKAPLWSALRRDETYAPIKNYLQGMIEAGTQMRPFEFFSAALSRPCPADPVSGLRAFRRRLGEDALDPLDELLNAALQFEEDHVPALQSYLAWQKSGSTQIKRQMEESGGQVRIMTVHGSKGLQAPIVILPDTIRTMRSLPGQSDKRLLWPHKTGLKFPLWSPRKDMDFDIFASAREEIEHKDEQEYRRLLYVAMTRAEDRLYVTGYKNKKDIPESWYYYIRKGLESAPGIIPLDNGGLRLMNEGEANAPANRAQQREVPETPSLPEWLFTQAPEELVPPQPFTPSRPGEDEPATLSPLQSANEKRFLRGNITHKLLQFLPEIEPALREEAARDFTENYGRELSPQIRSDILRETLKILDDPEFSKIFGPGSRAEVPITGLINGTELISGQIDRLYIEDGNIWIVDFKTNRPPPLRPEDVPQIYKKQLRAYRDTLRAIYPDHIIHCALLWTDGPHLMPIMLA